MKIKPAVIHQASRQGDESRDLHLNCFRVDFRRSDTDLSEIQGKRSESLP
jgi:hypothetical protein